MQSVGWNQSDLARVSKISPQEIGQIVNMKAKPTPAQAIKILKAFQKKGYEINLQGLWPEAFSGFKEKSLLSKTKDIPLDRYLHDTPPQFQIASGEMEIIDAMNNKEIVVKLMEALTNKEKIAVKKYYFEGETYQSIADYFNVSHQRAEQIVCKSMQKMKKRAQVLGMKLCEHVHEDESGEMVQR